MHTIWDIMFGVFLIAVCVIAIVIIVIVAIEERIKMTKEKKLDRLYRLRNELKFIIPYPVCDETEQALNDAIKAYEEEPTPEEKALLQKWRDSRGISMDEFAEALEALQKGSNKE